MTSEASFDADHPPSSARWTPKRRINRSANPPGRYKQAVYPPNDPMYRVISGGYTAFSDLAVGSGRGLGALSDVRTFGLPRPHRGHRKPLGLREPHGTPFAHCPSSTDYLRARCLGPAARPWVGAWRIRFWHYFAGESWDGVGRSSLHLLHLRVRLLRMSAVAKIPSQTVADEARQALHALMQVIPRQGGADDAAGGGGTERLASLSHRAARRGKDPLPHGGHASSHSLY